MTSGRRLQGSSSAAPSVRRNGDRRHELLREPLLARRFHQVDLRNQRRLAKVPRRRRPPAPTSVTPTGVTLVGVIALQGKASPGGRCGPQEPVQRGPVPAARSTGSARTKRVRRPVRRPPQRHPPATASPNRQPDRRCHAAIATPLLAAAPVALSAHRGPCCQARLCLRGRSVRPHSQGTATVSGFAPATAVGQSSRP